MSTAPQQAAPPTDDAATQMVEVVVKAVVVIVVVLLVLPLLIPVAATRIGGRWFATRARFWIVTRRRWIYNTVGILAVLALVGVEVALVTVWVQHGGAAHLTAQPHWKRQAVLTALPWAIANFAAGALLLPAAFSLQRRRIANEVRTRRVSDVMLQERIESARRRAADLSAARRIGVDIDAATGQITGVRSSAVTAPHRVGDRRAFGWVTRPTVKNLQERFYDTRRVPDWTTDDGQFIALPASTSALRALLIAESGTGKTYLTINLILCALDEGMPVFFIDAKGDPADADELELRARSRGITVARGAGWDLFNGTAAQVTAKLMRLMPPPDGANQHYLNEIEGVLQAVQHFSPVRSVDELRDRLERPQQHVRDQHDSAMVTREVEKGVSAGDRALQALQVALRPLEPWIAGEDAGGWSYAAPRAQLTIVTLSPVDDAQARLGDLLLMDLRNHMTTRLASRDKSPAAVIVDEFPQLVTGASDPGDTAASLYETARSAGLGLMLIMQSPAGLSNDEVSRRRALSSGAALIFGRTKDSEEVVKYAGTVMQMEASGAATGEELRSGRAQHTWAVPAQDVREAPAGAFWIVQGGAIAPFRSLPTVSPTAAPPTDVDELEPDVDRESVDAEPTPAESATEA